MLNSNLDKKVNSSDIPKAGVASAALLREVDTRDINSPPSYYMAQNGGIVTELKRASVLGLSDVGNYVQLTTYTPWGEATGGYPTQIAMAGTSGLAILYYRHGSSDAAWSGWRKTPAHGNCGNVDLNTIWEEGIYSCGSVVNASIDLNYPVAAKGWLIVASGSNTLNAVAQIYLVNKGYIYYRSYWDGSWGAWRSTENITYSQTTTSFTWNGLTFGIYKWGSFVEICVGTGTLTSVMVAGTQYTIGTIAAEYRPSHQISKNIMLFDGIFGRIIITTAGVVTMLAYTNLGIGYTPLIDECYICK